jgi:hypothetical protein
MGMTWGMKVRGVAIALAVVAALALASGADFVNACFAFAW